MTRRQPHQSIAAGDDAIAPARPIADDLFVRTPPAAEPTRGRGIAPPGVGAIEQIEAALNLGAGFDPAKSTGIFTAGMAEYAEVALVGRLARAFAEQAPRATLRLLPLDGRDAAERLERGAIDVAVAHLRGLPATIESQTLLRDPFVVVVRRDHPLAAEPLSIEALPRNAITSRRGAFASGAIDASGGFRPAAHFAVARLSGLASGAAASIIAPCRPACTDRRHRGGAIPALPIDPEATVSIACTQRRGEPAQGGSARC